MRACLPSHLSCVQLFVTLWTVAYQALLSMGFSRHEYWSGLPCPLPRGFLGVASGKEPACQCRRPGFNPWARKIPWRRKWQPTPVFLLGYSHRQESGRLQSMGSKESDRTEATEHTHSFSISLQFPNWRHDGGQDGPSEMNTGGLWAVGTRWHQGPCLVWSLRFHHPSKQDLNADSSPVAELSRRPFPYPSLAGSSLFQAVLSRSRAWGLS